MSRRGMALLVTLVVLTLAGPVLVSVLIGALVELRAARAATGTLRVEAALLSTRADILADSIPLAGDGSGEGTPAPLLDPWRHLTVQIDGISRTAFLAVQPGPAGEGFVRLQPLGPRVMVFPVY